MGGQDKGLMDFDGQSIASHVLERLQPQVGSMLINANRNLNDWQAYGVPVVSDVIGGFSGPLAGVHAGMTVCKTPWLLTVPCDSPFLPIDLVERLANSVQIERADMAVARCAGRLHPVFMLLRVALLPVLEKYLQAGGRKIESWVDGLNRVIVDFDDPAGFININTLEELSQALRAQPPRTP
jgi:molybdopterin-guanine dinucleotide biosynthesis protein A